jgi:hypothetical protein
MPVSNRLDPALHNLGATTRIAPVLLALRVGGLGNDKGVEVTCPWIVNDQVSAQRAAVPFELHESRGQWISAVGHAGKAKAHATAPLGTPMAQVECPCAHFTPGRVCASASVWCARRPGFIGAWARPVRHGCGLGVYGPGFALVGGWVCSGAALRYCSVEIGWLHPEELCELDVHLAELQRPVSAAPPWGHLVDTV